MVIRQIEADDVVALSRRALALPEANDVARCGLSSSAG